jgi:hypothetical protein
MAVFQNYDPKKAGGVNANAFPNVHVYPWISTQQNVRANPNIASQPQRISPTERGATFPTSASGGGSLAPSYPVTVPTLAPNSGGSKGGCGCGGGCGKSMASGASPTASQLATGHGFHGQSGKMTHSTAAGFGGRITGVRGTLSRPVSLRGGGRTNRTPMGPMFGGGRR